MEILSLPTIIICSLILIGFLMAIAFLTLNDLSKIENKIKKEIEEK